VANIKSQIKRIKTNEKAYLRNKSVSSSIKTAVRKFRDAVAKGDAAATTTLLPIRSLQWLRLQLKPAFVNSTPASKDYPRVEVT